MASAKAPVSAGEGDSSSSPVRSAGAVQLDLSEWQMVIVTPSSVGR